MWFERNHNLIPDIDAEEYEMLLMPKGRVDDDDAPASLSLAELKDMPQSTLVAYLSCAGNKRTYLQQKFPQIKGLKWTSGGIANAKFRGVTLRYILLEKMGFNEEDLKGKHLIAFGYDADFQGKHYEVSIPCEQALDPANEVMLALELNGEPLLPEHGFPVRMVSPGCIAVRSCKWVQKLIISDEEADSTPQRRDYKIVKDKDVTTVEWDKHKPVYWHPLNSGIGTPLPEQRLTETCEIKGWAHGVQGTQATQVQLSFDEGKTWTQVDSLIMEDKPKGAKVWSWTLWRYKLDPSKFPKGPLSIDVRAIDNEGKVQDGNLDDLYNVRGIMNNAPHRVTVEIA